MTQSRTKCMIILSSKSSGSSALQNLLAELPQVNTITKTRHNKKETLFWTKAASILSLPQINMLDSEVPIAQKRARAELIDLLRENLKSYTPPIDDEELIFDGWRLLCHQYSPIFLEKSPHHLHQWSALELIARSMEVLSEIEFLAIGLVRNPMDMLYSGWQRWKFVPEKHQYEWYVAYRNLLRFQSLIGEKLVIVRYEDIVRDSSYLKEIYDFIGMPIGDNNYLHSKSIGKWMADSQYGFKLSEEVMELAERFGYSRPEMVNDRRAFLWPVFRSLSRR